MQTKEAHGDSGITDQKMNPSEATCNEWLTEIGATETCFVGDQPGPPDFEATYREDKSIAIEVTRTKEPISWQLELEFAFAKQLEEYIEEITNGTRNCPQWHASCEYDPRETRPPGKDDLYWRDKVQEALQQRGPGGDFQLLPPNKINGRGVRLRLHPATNEGSFTGVQMDQAIFVASELCRSIPEDIRRKTAKVNKGNRSRNYTRWWLVLSDEICISYPGALGDDSIHHLRQATQRSIGIAQWSKVVLLTRHVDPSKRPVHFIPLWENPLHPPLPPRL